MSAAVKAGRRQYSGDPGLLGGLVGGAVGFLTGGPAGAIAGAAAGLGINGKKQPPTAARVPFAQQPAWIKRASTRRIGPPSTNITKGGPRALPGKGTVRTPGIVKQPGAAIDVNWPFHGEPGFGVDWTIGGNVGTGDVYVEGTTGEIRELVQTDRKVTRYGSPPGPGYHLNKSGYWLKNGTYIPARTVWVKNRRRNPLNPRALDRAMGRLSSAKKASKKIGRISIRSACKHK